MISASPTTTTTTCTGQRGWYRLTTSPLRYHHLKYPLLQWGHSHYHTEGQLSPETRGTNYKTPSIQHAGVGLIYHSFLVSAFQHKRRATSKGWCWRAGGWALSYTWGPSSRLVFPIPILRHKWMTHWKQAKACIYNPTTLCLHQTETDTREDTASTQTEGRDWHLGTTCILMLISCHLPKPRPFLCGFGLCCWHQKPIQATHSLAPAPTDPIDDSHPRIKL